MTKLALLTYNVRGLAVGRRSHISNEVWSGAHWLRAPATEGIHALRNPEVEAGRGTVALDISLDPSPFISQEGISQCGRVVWICINHPIWGRLGMVGVYGPNSGEGQAALWKNLLHALDASYRWIMMGDYNMIDSQNSHWEGTGNNISGREGGAWQQLLQKFLLGDTFAQCRGHLLYSWDSMRIHGHNPANGSCPPRDRILRRLDRTYVASHGIAPPPFCLGLPSPIMHWFGRTWRLALRSDVRCVTA